MKFGSDVADPPEWYLNMRAARYLGIPPWDIENVAVKWRDMALMSEGCELEAEHYKWEAAQRAAQ